MSEIQPEQDSSPPRRSSKASRWATGCLALFVAALLGAGYMLWTVKRVPAFYRQAAAQVADPEKRAAEAAEFESKVEALQDEAAESPEWTQSFPQSELNSWLLHESTRSPEMLPKGVRQPLILITDGRFQLGVEVNWEDWTGVISVEAGVEVHAPRVLRFHLKHVRIGDLDVSMDEVRRRVQPQIEANQSEDYQAAWLETSEGPVIEVTLTNPDTAHLGLTEIKLEDGALTVRGINQSLTGDETDSDQRP